MKADKCRAEPRHVSEKEHCILCGKLTETAKDQPVSEREHYIEGAGQLCRGCFKEIYMPRNNTIL